MVESILLSIIIICSDAMSYYSGVGGPARARD